MELCFLLSSGKLLAIVTATYKLVLSWESAVVMFQITCANSFTKVIVESMVKPEIG